MYSLKVVVFIFSILFYSKAAIITSPGSKPADPAINPVDTTISIDATPAEITKDAEDKTLAKDAVTTAEVAPKSIEPTPTKFVHKPANLTKLDGRVVGGVEVQIEGFPYQVSVQYVWRHICGGALIGSKYIITAAHCTDGVHDPSLLKVRAGSSLHNSGGTMRSVKQIHQHPQYNSVYIDYDISILELHNPIYFGKTMRPIPLIEKDAVLPNGLPSIVSGWGYLAENGQGPHKLHAVSIPIVSRDRCSSAYGDGAITERMICAGIIEEGGKDACQGDSGGPLVADGKLVGIVSWGYGCARPKFPGVYTNVAAVREYVNSIH